MEDAKAETKNCSFCGYERPELERIDNGLEHDAPGYGYGDFCTVCRTTKGISCYFSPWDFRFDIEQVRIACKLENFRLDSAAEINSHLTYLRTMINSQNSTITALISKIKSLEDRLGR